MVGGTIGVLGFLRPSFHPFQTPSGDIFPNCLGTTQWSPSRSTDCRNHLFSHYPVPVREDTDLALVPGSRPRMLLGWGWAQDPVFSPGACRREERGWIALTLAEA